MCALGVGSRSSVSATEAKGQSACFDQGRYHCCVRKSMLGASPIPRYVAFGPYIISGVGRHIIVVPDPEYTLKHADNRGDACSGVGVGLFQLQGSRGCFCLMSCMIVCNSSSECLGCESFL